MIIYETIPIPIRGVLQEFIQVQKSFWSCTHVNTHDISIYIFYIFFTLRQLQVMNYQKNPSSTSKVTNNAILIILLNLFSIGTTFVFQATWVFKRTCDPTCMSVL